MTKPLAFAARPAAPDAIAFGARSVGPGAPVLLIAEVGMNHNGDLDLARDMIAAAGAAGVDAVKFQSFATDAFLAPSMPGRDERRAFEIPDAWYPVLQDAAQAAGVEFFSTPLDAGSAATLARHDVPFFKIASCDLTNLPLIEQVAGYAKPMIVSTGFGALGEIDAALETAARAGNDRVVLMHCVSVYPTPVEVANLAAIQTLRATFGVPVGLSDHSKDLPLIPALAAALGAVAIEKHFTTDRALPGYDHAMSETPAGLAQLVADVRSVPQALGDGRIARTEAELARRTTARRGLYWAHDVAAGSTVAADMLVPLRPAEGLAPARLEDLVGRRLTVDVEAGTACTEAQVDWT